jgi:hypothetical protein
MPFPMLTREAFVRTKTILHRPEPQHAIATAAMQISLEILRFEPR